MKKLTYSFAALIAMYLLLLIPPQQNETSKPIPSEIPFVWGQDELWQQLERSFQAAKNMDPEQLGLLIESKTMAADRTLHDYEASVGGPVDPVYEQLENRFFEVTPLIAAVPGPSDWHVRYYNRVRSKIKKDSSTWDSSTRVSRDTIYRILYGMRAAVEEIEMQWGSKQISATMTVREEPSATPSTQILGIEIHSGDLLVSRGGAAMSAFIARANDYPGNFSHVAIIYVEQGTNKPHIVEAHIDKGVTIATASDYLKDSKLRFMVLRPRFDLPEILANPMLPHQAAEYVFNEANNRHIPYDFAMNYFDSTAMFCSEVGSYAYRQFGVSLWEPKSTVSSAGIVSWLSTFGVENFFTLLPADLEYDPSLSVVSEWRSRDTLAKDRLDNAVMDALISRANAGEKLSYNRWMLPVARVLKAYSLIMNGMGRVAIIPEGMSVLTTLTNEEFKRRFRETKSLTLRMAEEFEKEEGYPPPYWELVEMAKRP